VNPSGETPVLKSGEEYIADSMKIVEHIDTKLVSKKVLFENEKVKEIVTFIEEDWRVSFSRVLVASAPPMQKVCRFCNLLMIQEFRPKMMKAFEKMEDLLQSDTPYFLGTVTSSQSDLTIRCEYLCN
jgi:glutathione S-transferase